MASDSPVDYSQSKFSIDFLLQHHDGHKSVMKPVGSIAGQLQLPCAQQMSPSPSPDSVECDDNEVFEVSRDGAGSSLSRNSEQQSESERRKRPRTAFTATQIKTLETEFEKNKYLSVAKRVELSKILGLSQQQLKVWYQNRRTKWKRKFANDLESMAQQYYSSMGMNSSRPMLIGDRLWIFNSPQDVPLNLRRNLMDNVPGGPPSSIMPSTPGLLGSLGRNALLSPLQPGMPMNSPTNQKRTFPPFPS